MIKNSVQKNVSKKIDWTDKKSVIAVLLAIGLILVAAYFIFDFRTNKPASAPNVAVNQPADATPQTRGNSAQLQVTSATDPAIAELVQTVFKHIFLPSGNVQVATVVKADDLRQANPVFYQFAKEGDKVLIYSDRAILYDPVADKVLDVLHGNNQPTK